MDAVEGIQVVVPNGKLRKRNGKVIHYYLVVEMSQPIVPQLGELLTRFVLSSQCAQSQPLIENLLGRSIVIIHRSGRLELSLRSLLPAFFSLLFLSFSTIGQTEIEIDVPNMCRPYFRFLKIDRKSRERVITLFPREAKAFA